MFISRCGISLQQQWKFLLTSATENYYRAVDNFHQLSRNHPLSQNGRHLQKVRAEPTSRDKVRVQVQVRATPVPTSQEI
jgi:hypothetical protein